MRIIFTLCICMLTQQIFAQPGTLDLSFGTNGYVTTTVRHVGEQAEDVIVQSDGSIIATGTGSDRNIYTPTIKLLPGGNFDSSFTGDGSRFNNDGYGYSVISRANNIFIASNKTYQVNNDAIAVFKLKANGSIDQSFGINGSSLIDFGPYSDFLGAIAFQDAGILVAGNISKNLAYTQTDFAVTRLNNNGSIDSTFGVNGKSVIDLAKSDYLYDIVVQPDGKIILAGFAYETNNDYALVRLTKNGRLDSSFGNNGKIIMNGSTAYSNDEANSVALQPDGKIVVGGTTNNFLIVFRLNADGSTDKAFGNNGKIVSIKTHCEGVLIQPDGKIILGGQVPFVLARFTSNGQVDNTFGKNGIVEQTVNKGNDHEKGIALSPDGKIVVTGQSASQLIVLKFNGDNNFITSSTFSGKPSKIKEAQY